MIVLFDVEWVTAADGSCRMTQLAALRTNTAWHPCADFYTLVKPAEHDADWSQVAYNGHFPDEFRAGADEEDALRSFFAWLKNDDLLCCWHYRNGKTLAALCERWFNAKLPCRWAAANQAVYDWFGRNHISTQGGLYQCVQLLGLMPPLPEHDARHDVAVLQALLAHLQLSSRLIFKAEHKKTAGGAPKSHLPAPAPSVREQAIRQIQSSPYNYIYLKGSPVFHRRECKLLLNSREILGSVHYKTAAKGRRPCKICKPVPLTTEQALTLAASYGPDQALFRQALLRYKRKCAPNERVTARLLGGHTVEIGYKALVGCCHNRIHPGKMTRKMMEAHDCLGKECRFFEKYEDAAYWGERDRKASLKQQTRQQRADQKEKQQQQEAAALSLKEQFQTYAEDAGYAIKIIRVQEEKKNLFKVFYVSENRFRDGNLFPNFLSRIREEHPSYSIRMRHIQDMNGHFVTIDEYAQIRR